MAHITNDQLNTAIEVLKNEVKNVDIILTQHVTDGKAAMIAQNTRIDQISTINSEKLDRLTDSMNKLFVKLDALATVTVSNTENVKNLNIKVDMLDRKQIQFDTSIRLINWFIGAFSTLATICGAVITYYISNKK